MSSFVGSVNGTQGLLSWNQPDLRIAPMWWRYETSVEIARSDTTGQDSLGSWVTPYWPGSGFVGDYGGDFSVLAEYSQWANYEPISGDSMRFGFQGVTRDQWGVPVAGMTVKLKRTVDDVVLDTQVSGPNGEFLLSTPYYPDTHYIYSHKTASPDLDGVSVNTLIAT